MKNKPLNPYINPVRWLILAAQFALAIFLLAPQAAYAVIAIQDGSPLTLHSLGGGPTVTTPFTVTAGASVLVVILEDRQNAAILAEPSTITWNGQTLNQDTNSLANVSNYRSMAMYHLYNPVPGTGNISVTYSTANNTIVVSAYTLSGVATTTAPIILQTNSGTSATYTNLSFTTSAVTAGSWASVGSIWGSTGGTLTTTGTGGTATMVSSTSYGSSWITAGYVANLSAGTDTIEVTNNGGVGTKGCLIAEVFAPSPLPSTPTNLVATPGSPAQVALTWNASANAANYNVKRGTTSGTYTMTNVVVGPATNYLDTQVLGGTTYYYVVSATNTLGESVNSTEVSATPTGPPLPPTGLTAVGTGIGQLTLQWNASFGATSYNVKSSTTSGAETTVGSTNSTHYVVNGLVSGTTYYFVVSSVGLGGETNSAEVTFANVPISLQDGNPLTVTTTTSTAISQSFTVTPGASVMVVCMEDRGATLPEPATLGWGNQSLTLDVQSAYTTGNARSLAIYHLYNPAAGTTNITGTVPGTSEIFLTAYTLAGVNTTIAPAIGSTNTGNNGSGVSSLSTNFSGVVVGSWAAVSALAANDLDTVAITGTGGTATIVNGPDDGADTATGAGYVSGLSAGTVTLTASFPGAAGAQKAAFAAEIFTPNAVLPFPPSLSVQPQGANIFTNGTVALSVQASGTPPLYYQWYTNNTGSPLGNTANLAGSTSNVLTILNATLANAGGYTVVVTNLYGAVTSTVANVLVSAPSGYEAPAVADGPLAFYEFNDTGDPSTGTEVALDSMGQFDGVYSDNVENGFDGISGPQASVNNLPGFPNGNFAVQFTEAAGQQVTLPPLNLNTNAVTITAWINPPGPQEAFAGLVYWRGTSVAGLCFGGTLLNGDYQLGYNWNNDNNNINWNSGLTVPQNQWSLVALTVSATNATLYVIGTNGLVSSTHTYAHPVQAFNSDTTIGNDTDSSTRNFNGVMDDVAIYNSTLSQAQMLSLFAAASGISYFPASITSQPQPETIFTGDVASFSVVAGGSPTLTYQWYKNSTPLANGPSGTGSTIAGVTNVTLTISNVAAGDMANYYVVVGNLASSVPSSTNALTVLVPSGEPYEAAVLADGPAAFYEFNETADPATNNTVAYDCVGGYNGIYGISVENGNPNYNIQGPQPDFGFPGFSPTNLAAQFFTEPNSDIALPPLNLKTNNWAGTTISAWLNPNSSELNATGILFTRNSLEISGLCYNNAVDINGNHTLTYTWNDSDVNTYEWNSGLVAPQNQWSLVVLTVTPTNATIYVVTTNSFLSSTHVYNHIPTAFSGTSLIGDDSFDGGNGTRAFSGTMDDVAVFNQPLSANQVLTLFSAASGISTFAPTIVVSPTNETVYAGQTVQLQVVASGTQPLAYQWMAGVSGSGVYSNLFDAGNLSGSSAATLTISNVNFGNAADYIVVVTNLYGSTTSSVPATLTVMPTGPATNFTLNFNGTPVVEGIGSDWNTLNVWNPGGLPAATDSLANPGSTFELVVGSRMRNPAGPIYNVFPGTQLIVDGDGIVENGTVNNVSEIRFKNTAASANTNQLYYTTNYFPNLVLNGGQLNIGDNTTVILQGQLTALANSVLYNSGNGTGETYQVDAYLTGSGNLQFFNYNMTNLDTYNSVLEITGSTNTFTGTWDIELGELVGRGANSLGTNTILINTNGLLETLYPINNLNAGLILNGRMFLTQADTFRYALVNGKSLAAGTYSAAALNAYQPGNFPATFPAAYGAPATSATGSITVLSAPAPVALNVSTTGPGGFQISWPQGTQGTLLQATNIVGPWTVVTGAGNPHPVVVSPGTPALFFKLQQ